MAKNKQSYSISSVKMLNVGFINKHIIKGGGYLVLINYQLITKE